MRALALVGAEGKAQLGCEPEPVLLQRVGQRLVFQARAAVGRRAAAAAVVRGLEEQEEVVNSGRRVHTAAARNRCAARDPSAEGGPAREVAAQLQHEYPQR